MKKNNYQSIAACRIAALVLLNMGLWAVSGRAALYTATYLGGSGVWEQDGSNWDTIAYPQNGHYVIINGNPYPDGNPTYNVALDNPAPCTLSIGVTVQAVDIANGSTLSLANNSSLRINGPLTNDGSIFLNSTGGDGKLVCANGSSLGATGSITMSNNTRNEIYARNDGDTLTIAAGGSISGAGQFNVGAFDLNARLLHFVNHGLINATLSQGITLGLHDGVNAPVTNDGTLRASNGSTLRFFRPNAGPGPGTIINAGGTIEALNNSLVRLGQLVVVEGGIVTSGGTGAIRGDSPGSGCGTLSNVTNTGTVAIPNDEQLALAGTLTNNGLVRLDSTGSTAQLLLRSNVTVTGTGSILMGNNDNRIGGDATPGYTLTVAPGAKIQGGGSISGFNDNFNPRSIKLVNQGLIESNSGGMTLYVRSSATSDVINSSTLRANNGSTLAFQAIGTGLVTNTGGVIEALDTSIVRLGGGITVEGGTVTSSGTGAIRGGTPGTGGGTLSNVTNTGTVAIPSDEVVGLAGTLTNNGLVRLGNTGGAAQLLLRNNATVAGTGSILMSNNFGNQIGGDGTPGHTLTVAPGATIRGGGRFSGNNDNFNPRSIKLVNQGLIEAISGMTLFVGSSASSDVINSGTFRAGNGVTLAFQGSGTGILTNNGGVFEALAGGQVLFTSVTLTNYSSPTQTLSGGVYLATDGTLNLNIGPVVINAATVVLSGSGSIFTPIDSIRQNDGTFVITNGRNFSVAPLPPAASSPTGAASAFTNVGNLVIGPNSTFTVDGDYAQGSQSSLEIVLGADYPNPNFHHMNVTGTAHLAGTLEVTLANGYTPAPNQTFEIINAGAIDSGFVNVIGATVTYTATKVIINPTGTSTPLQLSSAVSRKTHGIAGTFDISVLNANFGPECRSSGGNHKLVFTFNHNVVSGSASVTAGIGSISGAPIFAGKTMTVNLSGVANAQKLTVTLSNVTDTASEVLPNTAAGVNMLIGDSTGNKSVNSSDIGQTKSQSGHAVTSANFRQDVTANGAINASDIALVKSRSGTGVP